MPFPSHPHTRRRASRATLTSLASLAVGFLTSHLIPTLAATHPTPAPTANPAGIENPTETPPDPQDQTSDDAPRARLTVQGLGWIENLTLKNLIRRARPDRTTPATYDATFIEDSGFLIANHVQRLGFLDARVTARATRPDGTTDSWTWSNAETPDLPRPYAAQRVDFDIQPGLRYYYEDLAFEGIEPHETERARAFFVRADGLLRTRAALRFGHDELQDALGNLRTALQADGHHLAQVTLESLDLDRTNATARARVRVTKGPTHTLRHVDVRVRDTPDGPVTHESVRALNRPYSRTAREDLQQSLAAAQYREGYPDASVRLSEPRTETGDDGVVAVHLAADVIRGPRTSLGQVRFESPVTLRNPDRLTARTRLEGPWLDRLAVDEARTRLMQRGAYRQVRTRLEPSPDNPDTRDVVYELEPGRRLTADLLAGYRSYDLLYAGFDVVRRDIFGLGHIAELRASQSFKSTEGSLAYSIPDAFAEDVTVFSTLEFLHREEISFDREEIRTGAGIRKNFANTGHQLGLRYTYEILLAADAPFDPRIRSLDPNERVEVGALTLDWALDRRDSALRPRRGYQLAASLETATPEFGGDSRYLRPEVQASLHFPIRGGRYVHAGFRYTAVADPGDDGRIPFNKRVFPGGEDSVRGYQRGEAGPRNADGNIVGAVSALVWMIELEQALTPAWSVVGFFDGVAQAATFDTSPVDETLWAAGIGIRWNSFIGPVRLEYGRNLNARPRDPAGTLHFSIGFPF